MVRGCKDTLQNRPEARNKMKSGYISMLKADIEKNHLHILRKNMHNP